MGMRAGRVDLAALHGRAVAGCEAQLRLTLPGCGGTCTSCLSLHSQQRRHCRHPAPAPCPTRVGACSRGQSKRRPELLARQCRRTALPGLGQPAATALCGLAAWLTLAHCLTGPSTPDPAPSPPQRPQHAPAMEAAPEPEAGAALTIHDLPDALLARIFEKAAPPARCCTDRQLPPG